jgi:hypothetical protein
MHRQGFRRLSYIRRRRAFGTLDNGRRNGRSRTHFLSAGSGGPCRDTPMFSCSVTTSRKRSSATQGFCAAPDSGGTGIWRGLGTTTTRLKSIPTTVGSGSTAARPNRHGRTIIPRVRTAETRDAPTYGMLAQPGPTPGQSKLVVRPCLATGDGPVLGHGPRGPADLEMPHSGRRHDPYVRTPVESERG